MHFFSCSPILLENPVNYLWYSASFKKISSALRSLCLFTFCSHLTQNVITLYETENHLLHIQCITRLNLCNGYFHLFQKLLIFWVVEWLVLVILHYIVDYWRLWLLGCAMNSFSLLEIDKHFYLVPIYLYFTFISGMSICYWLSPFCLFFSLWLLFVIALAL